MPLSSLRRRSLAAPNLHPDDHEGPKTPSPTPNPTRGRAITAPALTSRKSISSLLGSIKRSSRSRSAAVHRGLLLLTDTTASLSPLRRDTDTLEHVLYPEYDASNPDHDPMNAVSRSVIDSVRRRPRSPSPHPLKGFAHSRLSRFRRGDVDGSPTASASTASHSPKSFLESLADAIKAPTALFYKDTKLHADSEECGSRGSESPQEKGASPRKSVRFGSAKRMIDATARSAPIDIPKSAPCLPPMQLGSTPLLYDFDVVPQEPIPTARPQDVTVLKSSPEFREAMAATSSSILLDNLKCWEEPSSRGSHVPAARPGSTVPRDDPFSLAEPHIHVSTSRERDDGFEVTKRRVLAVQGATGSGRSELTKEALLRPVPAQPTTLSNTLPLLTTRPEHRQQSTVDRHENEISLSQQILENGHTAVPDDDAHGKVPRLVEQDGDEICGKNARVLQNNRLTVSFDSCGAKGSSSNDKMHTVEAGDYLEGIGATDKWLGTPTHEHIRRRFNPTGSESSTLSASAIRPTYNRLEESAADSTVVQWGDKDAHVDLQQIQPGFAASNLKADLPDLAAPHYGSREVATLDLTSGQSTTLSVTPSHSEENPTASTSSPARGRQSTSPAQAREPHDAMCQTSADSPTTTKTQNGGLSQQFALADLGHAAVKDSLPPGFDLLAPAGRVPIPANPLPYCDQYGWSPFNEPQFPRAVSAATRVSQDDFRNLVGQTGGLAVFWTISMLPPHTAPSRYTRGLGLWDVDGLLRTVERHLGLDACRDATDNAATAPHTADGSHMCQPAFPGPQPFLGMTSPMPFFDQTESPSLESENDGLSCDDDFDRFEGSEVHHSPTFAVDGTSATITPLTEEERIGNATRALQNLDARLRDRRSYLNSTLDRNSVDPHSQCTATRPGILDAVAPPQWSSQNPLSHPPSPLTSKISASSDHDLSTLVMAAGKWPGSHKPSRGDGSDETSRTLCSTPPTEAMDEDEKFCQGIV